MAHPKVDLTPWAREALRPAILRAIELGAGQLKANLNAGGSSARGPWVVRVWTGERTVEHRGFDLEGICFEALERFALGADTRSARWTAGADGLAHGHVGTPWTLCKLGAVDPRFAYPETARCRACLRALDVRVAA